MDFNQYLLALKARRKVYLMVLAATVVTAVTVALIVPKRYDATATVLIDSRDEQTMSPAHISPRERAGYVFTQVDLIQSGRVAHKVVRDLKLAQEPGVREEWERDTGGVGTLEDWIAANLLEKLKVDTGASNVLIIKFSSREPKKAAAVANGFAKAYLDVALAMRTEPARETAEWFEQQLKALRTDVTQAQSKLTAFQKEKGVIGADEGASTSSTRALRSSRARSTRRGTPPTTRKRATSRPRTPSRTACPRASCPKCSPMSTSRR